MLYFYFAFYFVFYFGLRDLIIFSISAVDMWWNFIFGKDFYIFEINNLIVSYALNLSCYCCCCYYILSHLLMLEKQSLKLSEAVSRTSIDI